MYPEQALPGMLNSTDLYIMMNFRNISSRLSYMIDRGIDMNSDFHAFRLQIGGAAVEDTQICLKFNHQFGSPASYTGRSRNM